MKHRLKVCATGVEDLERETVVEISEKDGWLTFVFTAKNSKYYYSYNEYNKIHAVGDVCEVFIGTHPEGKEYYEIELTPKGAMMLAKITYLGENLDGPITRIDFIEKSFVQTQTHLCEDGYVATLSFPKSAVETGKGELFLMRIGLIRTGENFWRINN